MSGSASYVPLDELVGAIGDAAAVKLLAAYGGTRIYVPAEPAANHKISEAIGTRAAAQLARHLASGIGGLWIELPRGPSGAAAEARRRLLAAAAMPGKSEAQIAREQRVHGRTVRRARAKIRDDERSPQRRLL